MAGDGYVVLRPTGRRREPQVTAGLAGNFVSVPTEERGECGAREVSRELQAGMTSSLTKCSRMSFGPAPSS